MRPSIRELAARITELAGHLHAANRRWLVLIAEFDRRHGWSDGVTQRLADHQGTAAGSSQCVIPASARGYVARSAMAAGKLRISSTRYRGSVSVAAVTNVSVSARVRNLPSAARMVQSPVILARRPAPVSRPAT